MTKNDIITEVAKALNTSTQKAKPMVEALFEELKTSMETGEGVEITGFGKFVIRQKASRMGRNPMTGEEAEVTARKVVSFKPSRIFRKAVNDSKGN
jgi:integration host factor subunit alpha